MIIVTVSGLLTLQLWRDKKDWEKNPSPTKVSLGYQIFRGMGQEENQYMCLNETLKMYCQRITLSL